MMKRLLFAVGCLGCVTAAALADDAGWSGEIDGTGVGAAIQVQHEDTTPWAGWFQVTATNTGTEPWGDFHFFVFAVPPFNNIENIDWQDGIGLEPTSTQSLSGWSIDNSAIGATIDLYYYGDPVYPNQTATFSVYNVNPDQLTFFGVGFYPTPVPEPSSVLLLACGALLLRRR